MVNSRLEAMAFHQDGEIQAAITGVANMRSEMAVGSAMGGSGHHRTHAVKCMFLITFTARVS